ncbi:MULTISPECIES: DMT family transporter [unclassified Streptomyces]|uniref:DMT family transporter n=1 Tax=unclassified Streptomyces TaxID=2593676 RepID=UPI0006B015B1|nr:MULTISPECIES: DMT family transporter [unclassified Streptomyces]KOX16395.1 multidrug DMT transporter permease [Streptomyces sp. NRRL F-6491]KOX39236.1 multidrug DMT transporter permease [Streptomyces sp. NRRL F-6492]
MSRATCARLAALSLVWGSVFLWIKIAGYGFSPVQTVLVRLALGAAVLLAIGYARGFRLPREKAVWGHLTVAALLGNAIPWTLYAEGEIEGSTGVAAVVNGSAPIWTLATALLLGREKRVSGAKAGGALLGLGGTALIASPWNSASAGSGWSILCFVLGSISFGAGFAYTGRFLVDRNIPPLVLAGGQFGAATVLLLLAFPFLGLQGVTWRADSVVSLLVLGVVCTGFAALLNFELILKDGAAVASTVTYLMTVVAVLLGAVVLREPFGRPVWLGAAAVLAATGLLRRGPSPERRTRTAEAADRTSAPPSGRPDSV